MTKRSTVLVLLALVAVWAGAAQAEPIMQAYGPFDVTFYNTGDSNGYRTGEQDWTAQQMADIGAGVLAWDDKIGNVPGRQIELHVFWRELDAYGETILGGSGSGKVADGTTIWQLGEYVWREGGTPDTTSHGFDTIIEYDITCAGFSWNFGTGTPTGSQVDFRSVVTHEIGHSLGWSDSYDETYNDWGWFGPPTNDYVGLTTWDKNLQDETGNTPPLGGGPNGNFNTTDNPVYWTGTNAVDYYGARVPIYAPATYKPGSSLCHLNESTFPNALLSPFIGVGQMVRQPTKLEWEMMRDMDWRIIPEPACIAIIGMALLAVKRRRN